MEETRNGRPPLFDTVEALDEKIQKYFIETAFDGKEPTITGLAYFLGFESRQSFYDYEKKDDFTYTIKRARLSIESNYEQHLFSKNPTGSIFALKNLGWTDRQEIDHTTRGEKIEQAPPVNVYNTAPPLSDAEDKIDGK